MAIEFTKDEILEVLKLNDIPIIDNNVNYWFVRTNGGEKFEDFYFGHYIAIAWDKLNDLELLKRSSENSIKDSVKVSYPDEAKPGYIASNISRFVNKMQLDDYVLVPNSSCERIAIGKITSDVYVHEEPLPDFLI